MSNETKYGDLRIKMRGEYPNLSWAVFDLCFEKAWADGHAYGYNEVEYHMADVVEFANELLKANT